MFFGVGRVLGANRKGLQDWKMAGNGKPAAKSLRDEFVADAVHREEVLRFVPIIA